MEVKYPLCLETLDVFTSYLRTRTDSCKHLNFNNIVLLDEFYAHVGPGPHANKTSLHNTIRGFFLNRRAKRGVLNSVEYWTSLGWDKEHATDMVSKYQSQFSRFSVVFWQRYRGLSEIDAIAKVRRIQQRNSRKLLEKYSPIERSSMSVFNLKYWTDLRGMTDDEAKHKVRSMNPSCREHYGSDDDFNEYVNADSKRTSDLWKTGVFDGVFKTNEFRQSTEEIEFFRCIESVDNVKHKSFFVFKYGEAGVFRRICDGYYKDPITERLIMIEYDGAYWHKDQDVDRLKDETMLSLRPDIVGVIRVQCHYFKNNTEIIVDDVRRAISAILSENTKIVMLYC